MYIIKASFPSGELVFFMAINVESIDGRRYQILPIYDKG